MAPTHEPAPVRWGEVPAEPGWMHPPAAPRERRPTRIAPVPGHKAFHFYGKATTHEPPLSEGQTLRVPLLPETPPRFPPLHA